MSEPPEPYVPPPPRSRVDVDAGPAMTRVAIAGEIDISTIDSIEHKVQLARARPEITHFVVDLRGTTFMDSTGLRLLVSLLRDSQTGGYRLTVVRPASHVYRAVEITGLGELLDFVDEPPHWPAA